MVPIKQQLSNRANYGTQRDIANVKYLVIHGTGNDGDHDESNGNYFQKNIVKASAHYFVDDDSITQSVLDNYSAYAVGGKKYNNAGGRLHGTVNNSNSISIELCDTVKNGTVYPTQATINNALDLVRKLMAKYNIPLHRVIRHYDVNGKTCPAYWVNDTKWQTEFLNKIGEKFEVEMNSTPVAPDKKATFGMYMDKQWYKLTAKPDIMNNEDPVKALDVSILQDNLLGPVLGIEDPRVDKRIDFIGGIRGLSELEKRADNDMYVSFSMYPTSISELFDVADAGLLMPPKSTWFEPKLRSGIFIHRLS